MKVHIETYNKNWPLQFIELSTHLGKVLAEIPHQREHIGSTSITGLAAKPIIDILIGLYKDEDLNKVVAPMIDAGYTYFRKYEPDMPYRRLFVQLTSLSGMAIPPIIDIHDDYITGVNYMPATNIHILVKDTHHWTRHLAFRDYLREHPAIRDNYELLKRELAQRDFTDHLEYNKAKNSFVKNTEQEALNWYLNQAD